MGLSGGVWDRFRHARDFDECRGECVRPAADACTKIVSGVFAGAADRHLNNHGGKWRQDEHEYRADDAETAVAVPIAAAEEHASIEMAPAMVAVIVIVSVS